jgi:hypothetical protein
VYVWTDGIYCKARLNDTKTCLLVIIGVTDASYKPYIVYCEGKQYRKVFKPVADKFERRHLPLVYYTSAQDDPVFEQNYQFVKFEYINEGNTASARLNPLSAGVVHMTTTGLQVYQL